MAKRKRKAHNKPIVRVVNKFDIQERRQQRKRITPPIETRSPDKARTPATRLEQAAIGRDNVNNSSSMRSMVDQLVLNAYGNPKVLFETEDDKWNETASTWFNSIFAKKADGRDDKHLHYQNEIVLASVISDGDMLQYFDSTGVLEAGKLFYWESDQMAAISDKEFEENMSEIQEILGFDGKLIQADGLICDTKVGRTRGYIVNPEHGVQMLKYDKVSILPADSCNFMKRPRRINQKRGISELMTPAIEMTDLREIQQALLARMKAQSFFAMAIKKNDSVNTAVGRTTYSEATEETTGDGTDKVSLTDADVSNDSVYKNFEALTTGAIEYLERDDEIQALSLSGDSVDADVMKTSTLLTAGSALSLPRVYALMKAEASFSAMRGEQSLAKKIFDWWQKWIERNLLDFEVEQAIMWAIQTGALKSNNEWLGKFTFHGYAEIEPIDAGKTVKANKEKLKAGLTTYKELLGPNWKSILKQLQKEQAFAQEIGLILDTFEQPTEEIQTNEKA